MSPETTNIPERMWSIRRRIVKKILITVWTTIKQWSDGVDDWEDQSVAHVVLLLFGTLSSIIIIGEIALAIIYGWKMLVVARKSVRAFAIYPNSSLQAVTWQYTSSSLFVFANDSEAIHVVALDCHVIPLSLHFSQWRLVVVLVHTPIWSPPFAHQCSRSCGWVPSQPHSTNSLILRS